MNAVLSIYESRFLKPLLFGAILFLGISLYSLSSLASEAMVYSVQKSFDLGAADEEMVKDYYLNVGQNQGINVGSMVEVARKVATYDLSNQKLYKDVTFPFAKLKVIHVEKDAAIARIEKLYPSDRTPTLTPRAVMVGDLVRPAK
jgi:hypothetical protein